MPEILSQSQIDNLLNELSSSDANCDIPIKKEKKIKDYDFKSPKKFSKEQLKILTSIYDNFARHLSSYFSGILRVNSQINVATVEEQPYYEYNNALPDSVLIGVLDLKPFERSILVDISNPITFTIIERLLGGSGTSVTLNREFTEIEIALMDKIFRQIVIIKKDVWSNYLTVEPKLERIETNARLIQSLSSDDIVVIVVMDVIIKSVQGTISVCIPCANLESLLNLSTHNQTQTKKAIDDEQDNAIKDAMKSHIQGSRLQIDAIFGSATLTLKEVHNLQIGDVVMLEQRVDGDVKVNIENKTWFYGTPGIKKNKKVIKINKVI
jgi:flagellar motor switch protein FliM